LLTPWVVERVGESLANTIRFSAKDIQNHRKAQSQRKAKKGKAMTYPKLTLFFEVIPQTLNISRVFVQVLSLSPSPPLYLPFSASTTLSTPSQCPEISFFILYYTI